MPTVQKPPVPSESSERYALYADEITEWLVFQVRRNAQLHTDMAHECPCRTKRTCRAEYVPQYQIINHLATKVGPVPIINGDINLLPKIAVDYIVRMAQLMRPRAIQLCDGSVQEADEMTRKLVRRGVLYPLPRRENCYLARTDPRDTARVEKKTFMITPDRRQTECKTTAKTEMSQWMSPESFCRELHARYPGCMMGRTMFVVPFSMGHIGAEFSKVGVELTDSPYVVLSMRIMCHVSVAVWDVIRAHNSFVKCIHSVGRPKPVKEEIISGWPCNPDKTLITHIPEKMEIWSFGSGYGGNSLLGKKCFALRIGSCIGRDEGWLAEHMLIMSVTNDCTGKEYFFSAAFPSACGKTNLAMLTPAIPGYTVKVIGDDIAWMKFNKEGRLMAINPEAGFFGVAPGTSTETNLVAMRMLNKDCLFTNVGLTQDGDVFWEGLENEMHDKESAITSWTGEPWHMGDKSKCAQPNSRFTVSTRKCPILHEKYDAPEGVPIDAIIFGGRRPEGVPLVFETLSWPHGVYVGASVKSETTAAQEDAGKIVRHDPMGMRPFMGYNFGHYLQHWLDMEQTGRKMPKIFHVNWFRKSKTTNQYLWPGFGQNIRVLQWIMDRVDEKPDSAVRTAIGWLPRNDNNSLNMEGLGDIDKEELFSLPVEYWTKDSVENKQWLEEQLGEDMPSEIRKQLNGHVDRIKQLSGSGGESTGSESGSDRSGSDGDESEKRSLYLNVQIKKPKLN